MGFAQSLRGLDVYQNALELAVEMHHFCDKLPSKERFALADQMRRSSRSVHAKTEAGEMQSWQDLALRLEYQSGRA